MPNIFLTEHENHTLSLTFNRPERRNALSYTLLEELHSALESVDSNVCRTVIISGDNHCFSAGADLNEITGTIEDIRIDESIGRITDRIRNLPVPVIAYIEGACIGGAVDIALSCDLRVATHSALFQIPATRLGLLYNPDAVFRMSRMLARDTLIRLLALGERFNAVEAYRTGLITHLVEEGDREAKTNELITQSAANAERAVASTKSLINALYNGEYDPSYWHSVRKDILASAERRKAVATAKKK